MLRYAITNGAVQASGGWKPGSEIVQRCAELARDGVDFLLIREKQLPGGELVKLCREVRAVAAGTRVLVAGGRVDVAFAAGLQGVHLGAGEGELRADQVRRLFPEAFVSVSCHTLGEVERAREAGASAVLFGPTFGKTVGNAQVVTGVGLELLAEACRVGVPVFALGGISDRNAVECVAAGAVGVAGIRMFFE